MKFKLGQKVLCVDDHFDYGPSCLKKGSVYTIDGFYRCSCGSNQVTLVEIPDVLSMRCKCHQTSIRRQTYYNWRFVPLEYFEIFEELSSDINEVPEEIDVQNMEFQKEPIKTASMA